MLHHSNTFWALESRSRYNFKVVDLPLVHLVGNGRPARKQTILGDVADEYVARCCTFSRPMSHTSIHSYAYAYAIPLD
jgi:hypothetical protein